MNEAVKEELVIDQSNFDQYFFPIKKFGPKKGQVMAHYMAIAELVPGEEKGYLVRILATNPRGAEMGVQIMMNAFHSRDADAIRVCREIVEDLVGGMTEEEVVAKPYKYHFDMFFWTKEEYVPKDDPHWDVIRLINTQMPEEQEIPEEEDEKIIEGS